MANNDVVIDEYEFILLYLINMKVNKKLPNYLFKKKKYQNFDHMKISEEITKKLKSELSKEIFNLGILQ